MLPPIPEPKRVASVAPCLVVALPSNSRDNKSAHARARLWWLFWRNLRPDSGQCKVTCSAASASGRRAVFAVFPSVLAEYLNEDIYYNRDTED